MTILVLGGRGKTSIRLAHLLDSSRIPFIIASRTFSLACPYKQAHFDWEDENTYGNPFNQALASQLDPVSAVYIVPSYNIDNMSLIINFIDLARTKGVKRMVLMSASVLENGGQYMGQVHAYLESLQGYLDWTVLRPTWFMENFSEETRIIDSIKNQRAIYTSSGDGKIPFVSADDIARVAFRSLTDKQPHNTDHLILGPESLSYDEVAESLSKILGHKISHVNLPPDEFLKHLEGTGMDSTYAKSTVEMDEDFVKTNLEDRVNHVIEELTGVPPRNLQEFLEHNKHIWL